jgi:hypothetical protein
MSPYCVKNRGQVEARPEIEPLELSGFLLLPPRYGFRQPKRNELHPGAAARATPVKGGQPVR